jgi:hypothetical protein
VQNGLTGLQAAKEYLVSFVCGGEKKSTAPAQRFTDQRDRALAHVVKDLRIVMEVHTRPS